MEVASLVINPGFALFYLVVFRPFNLFLSYVRIYGYAGILLLLFGNNVVWKIQFEVLTRAHPQTALEYKSARQKESDTVAIAVRYLYFNSGITFMDIFRTNICKGFYFGTNCHHLLVFEQSQPGSLDCSRVLCIQSSRLCYISILCKRPAKSTQSAT